MASASFNFARDLPARSIRPELILASAAAYSAPLTIKRYPMKHIVICGAGIIGASLAYHLAKRGARVTILDAQHPSAGATGKSFGWLNATFSKRPRFYFDFSMLGIAGWR